MGLLGFSYALFGLHKRVLLGIQLQYLFQEILMPVADEKLSYVNQSDLWRHMMKSCAVPLVTHDEYRNRANVLRSLIDQVNDGSYTPAKFHGFLSAPKQNSVARFIPVFPYSDTAV